MVAVREAAEESVKRAVQHRTRGDSTEREPLYSLFRRNRWTEALLNTAVYRPFGSSGSGRVGRDSGRCHQVRPAAVGTATRRVLAA